MSTREGYHHVKKDKVYKGKYIKIGSYLSHQKEDILKLTYSEIEEIIQTKLPLSAYKYSAWWTEEGNYHTKSWLQVGWELIYCKLGREITFAKIRL